MSRASSHPFPTPSAGGFHRALLGAALLTCVSAGRLGAQQAFWNQKPYTDWSEEEARKILSDSPWARSKGMSSADRRQTIIPGTYSPLSPSGQMNAPSAPPDPEESYAVLWLSSLTVRQAFARLPGQPDLGEQTAALTAKFQHYILAISGPAVADFEKLNEREAQAHAWLQAKGGSKVAPESARYIRKDSHLEMALFYFPRQITGASVIGPNAEEVKFQCTRKRHGTIKATFDLRKMTRAGNPDL